MLVQQVLEFIDRLRNEHVHIECDVAFRKSISDYFSQKSSGSNTKNSKELSEEDFSFLINCYALRWNEVHAKYRDAEYTRSNLGFDQQLINFAVGLARERSIDFRSVLMPTVTNLVDPSDFSQINDFGPTTLSDFYITDDLLLQRKLPWLQYMTKHDNVLFSFSSLDGRKKATSIYELKSLKNCNEPSFWTKLKEEIFPFLTQSGKLSEEVVVLLSDLLHSYFSLKQSQKNIHLFKEAIQNFFHKLSTSSLDDINFLYGQKIKYQGIDVYLLDLLISLTTVGSFNVPLEQEMNILLGIVRSAKSAELLAYEKLHSILVSLLVTDFNLYRFTGAYVLSWDTCSHIPSALSPVFTNLKSICSVTPNYESKYNEILETRAASQDSAATSSITLTPKSYVAKYKEILSMLVLPSNPAGSWWAWLTVNAELFNWISEITISEQPSKVGGYWFEPSVIMHSILQLPISMHNDKLLDGLIRTYSQMRMSDFMQQLRLNKLFSEFMSELSESRRKNILSLIETCNVDKAKEHFFNNCTTYLNRRLRELDENLDDASPSFFASSSIAVSNPDNMLALLTLYTTKLAKRHAEAQFSPGLLYLHDLKDIILTKKEIWDAHRAVVGTEDTLGPQGAR
ncbi:MAG: hypothetical protein P4L65_07935 [Legionella sp.]|nr:hypothetical protein [Legionella sp.]